MSALLQTLDSMWLHRVIFVAVLAAASGCGTAPDAEMMPNLDDSPSGPTITYRFTGYLESPFGTLQSHEFFFGSFTYVATQKPLPPHLDAHADYRYKSLSLTIGPETATDAGSGVIQVADRPSLPSDAFFIYPFAMEARLGGRKLSPLAGIQLVLSDPSGTVFASNALPGPGLTLDTFTFVNNASSLKLQSPEGGEGFCVLLSLHGEPDPDAPSSR